LGSAPPETAEPDRYVYDPRDLSNAALEATIDPMNMTEQRMIAAAIGKHLIYHSPPFDQDTEVSGFFTASLWLSIDQPDTDFRVTIFEIALDGRSTLLSMDAMRARYRESPRKSVLIDTPTPLKYDFERFTFISRRLPRGHRLRLVIGPINSIYAQKNHNSGADVADESLRQARPVTVRLFHDRARPSALFVPLGHPDPHDPRPCE
jgi:hypothetical protein